MINESPGRGFDLRVRNAILPGLCAWSRCPEFVEGVNAVLKEVFTSEAVAVEGEVSGFRVSQGQWVSFDLKDDKALVNVFLTVWNLRVPVEDGLVRVFGSPRVYPKYRKFSCPQNVSSLRARRAAPALALLRARLTEGALRPVAQARAAAVSPEGRRHRVAGERGLRGFLPYSERALGRARCPSLPRPRAGARAGQRGRGPPCGAEGGI